MYINRFLQMFVFISLVVSMGPLCAEEQVKTSEDAVEVKPAEESDKKTDETETSEVERILKLETTLKNEKKSLRDIKKNLVW